METSTQTKPDARSTADKLRRLFALALNDSSADGEAMNALRAARKIVSGLGGFDAAMKALGGVVEAKKPDPPKTEEARTAEDMRSAWSYMRGKPGTRPDEPSFRNKQRPEFSDFVSQFYYRNMHFNEDVVDDLLRQQEELKAYGEKHKADQARDAETNRKNREWELKQAIKGGLPFWDAVRRRRLWKNGETFDESLDIIERMCRELDKEEKSR